MKTTLTQKNSTSKKVKTEKQKKQKDLSELNRKQLQNIFQHVPAATAVFEGPEHKYILANKAYQKLFNREEKDLLGKSIHEVFPELKGTGTFELVGRVFETGESFTTPEYAFLIDAHHDGILRQNFYEFSLNPLKNDSGEIYAVVAITYDITEQVESRKKVEASEKRYNMMLMQSPFAIAVLKGKDMVVAMANDSIKQMWGKGNNIEGKPLLEVLPEINNQEYPELLDKVYTTGNPYVLNEALARLNRKGKMEDAYFNYVYQPYRETDDTISGVTVIAIEVTEQVLARKKIEENEKQKTFLLKLTDATRWLSNPVDVEETATKIFMEFMDADRCYYCAIEEGNAIVHCDSLRGNLPSVVGVYPLKSYPLFKAMFDAGHPFFYDDLQTTELFDEDLKKVCLQYQLISKINIPVIKNGKPVGLLALVQSRPRKWTDSEVQLTIEVAQRIWAKIEKAKSEEALHISEEKFRTLFTSIDQGFTLCELIRNKEGKAIDFYMVEVNPTYEKQTGVPKEMVLGKALVQAFPSLKGLLETYAAVVDNQCPAVFEDYFKDTDRWFSIKAYPVGKERFAVLFSDITERKQASQYARSLIEASLDPLVTISANGKITDVNDASIKVTGIEREKLIDTDFSNYFTEPEKAQEGYKQVFEKGFVADYPLTIKHKNGNLTDVLYNATVYKDDKGNVLGVFAAARDVTERKKVEEKLLKSEQEIRKIKEQLELSIRAGKIGVWFWDVKKDILTWSNEQKEMYGFSASEVVSEAAQFNALIFPDDLNRIQVDQSKGKLDHEYDFRIIRKNDGEVRWIKSRAKNTLDPQGALQFISGVNIDVTEQVLAYNKIEESEKRFRNLAETLPQMVWVMNVDGSMEYSSKNWKEYSGIDDVMEAWTYMMHPDDRERLTLYQNHVFLHGKGYQHEIRLKSKEGTYRWFYSVGEPVLDAEGKVSKWVGSLTDIQDQKHIEEMLETEVAARTKELEQKNTELQNINIELEAFNYISSHDLQEPLRKIQTFAGRIIAKEKEQLSDTAKDYFSRIQKAATRMQNLIQDLLLFSHVSKSERKFEITGMSKMVDEVKEELIEVIEAKHALIQATELCEVNVIPFQFRQLLHNLISNALKFSKVDVPPRIIIKSIIANGLQLNNDKLLPDTKYCHISFADNGIGFDKSFSEKIFGLFQRLHSKEEYAGTGIGLAIVKKIVDNHHGIVTAESELGKGTTFNIYLPM